MVADFYEFRVPVPEEVDGGHAGCYYAAEEFDVSFFFWNMC